MKQLGLDAKFNFVPTTIYSNFFGEVQLLQKGNKFLNGHLKSRLPYFA